MASRQEKEQRKETEASDLSDVNRDKERERPGVIGSVIKAVQSAKEAVVGKTNDEHGTRNEDVEETTESAARTLDEKAREMKERARKRILEMKENAKDAANETKGYVAEKVRESSDRTKQMAESAKGKTTDTEQSATEKTKEKTLETSQLAADKTKEKSREVQEEARPRMEGMRLTYRDKYEGDLAGREDRGGRILGALGTLKEKLTPHMSNGDKPRQSMDVSRVTGTNEGEKKAQTFNEVGRIDHEGVGRIVRRDLRGKM